VDLFGSANLASTKRVSGRVARLTPSPPDGRASGFGKGGGRSSVIGRRLYRIPRTDDRQHFADLDGSGSAVSFSLDRRSPALVIENNKTQRIRVNKQIRISPVRVIANDGEQLGVLPIDEALAAAQARGLDLVEVRRWPARPSSRSWITASSSSSRRRRRGREEEAARDPSQGGQVPPRDRRSRFRVQDAARAGVSPGRQTR